MIAAAPAQPPALVYAARYYDPRPSVRTYSHLYLWRVGQKGRGQLLTTGANDDTEPQASHDGKTIYFVRTRDKKPPTVCAFELSTGKVQSLYSAAAPSSTIDRLQIAPLGNVLLVHHTAYSNNFQKPYDEWVELDPAVTQKFRVESVWDGKNFVYNASAKEAVWAAAGQVVYLRSMLHEWKNRLPSIDYSIVAKTNHSAPGGYRLQINLFLVDAAYSNLQRDVSPNGAWLLSQPTWSAYNPTGSRYAQPIRISEDDNRYGSFTASRDETFYWLSDTRVVGIEPDNYGTPIRLHFFDFTNLHPKEGPVPPTPPAQTVELRILSDTKVLAALNGSRSSDRLDILDRVPGRSDGFVLGTPWHRGDNGVRIWIDAQTGQASLWSKCGPPHPSPSGAYFWSLSGKNFDTGKPPSRNDFVKPSGLLFVASYKNPAQLTPIVFSPAHVNGADWLPAAKVKEKSKQ